jgi:FAD dependent oxidoreductase
VLLEVADVAARYGGAGTINVPSVRRRAVVVPLSILLAATAVAGPSPAVAAPADATPTTSSASPTATPSVAPPSETVPPVEPPSETTPPEEPSPTPTGPTSAAPERRPAGETDAPTPSESPTSAAGPVTTTSAAGGTRAGGVKRFIRPDVVVYGGTPAGVSAAIAAAESGVRAVLVAEGGTVGGLMSNGISASDIGSPLAVQGLAMRFFDRIRSYYRDSRTWRFEPRIAERVLQRMLREAGVSVYYRSPLQSVSVSKGRIRCGEFGAALSACGTTFVDASYTGDLLAAAGAPHRLGMADYYSYPKETLPARRGWTSLVTVAGAEAAAARAAFEANPFVTVADALEPYDSAHRDGTPSITYRLCVTPRASNRLPFRPGASYDQLKPSFRLLAGRIRPDVVRKSNGTILTDAFHLASLPGGKYDLNSGRRSFTNLPTPPGYFDLSADRVALDRAIREYVESFFYFVRTDASVPAPIRKVFAPFGLCRDEFTDNRGWPREPYVREGRRLVGGYTMTETDIFTKREKKNSVALSSYNLDSKLSQFVFVDDTLYRDRGAHASAPIYEVPYEVLVPKAGSVVNLLVPVGVSASPTAYGSIRMEPQWMALGEASGIAAALATKKKVTVQSVPVASIQWMLRARKVVHKVRPLCQRTPPIYRPAGGYTFYCGVVPVKPRPIGE